MQWADEGIVLAARRHGESSAIASLLTHEHGRHAGLVRGGAGRRGRGMLQPGNRVMATWRARLADQLGSYALELVHAGAADLMDDAGRLAALAAACAVSEAALPERHPYPVLFESLGTLIAALTSETAWGADFVRWELGLLEQLGFGLDLAACAVSGATAGLAYVSPTSGRAVAEGAAGRYRDRLLPLPKFLAGGGEAGADDVLAGLRLTGSFLERHAFAPHGRRLPPARDRLVGMISLVATRTGSVRTPEQ